MPVGEYFSHRHKVNYQDVRDAHVPGADVAPVLYFLKLSLRATARLNTRWPGEESLLSGAK